MAPTRTQPAQKGQTSRKGKKAWRKNIDLASTEAFLEEERDPLRQTASETLFVEDRTGQDTLTARQARAKKPLKSLEILQRSYGHPALAHGNKARPVDRKLEQKLRRMVGRQNGASSSSAPVQGDKRALAEQSADVVDKTLDQVYDVWNGADLSAKGKSKMESAFADAPTVDEDWISTLVSKPIVQLPKTLRNDGMGDLNSQIPAIDLPHPGTSYNPTLEAHEALIQEAYEIEKRLEDNEQMDRAERISWQKRLATIVAREAELRAEEDDALRRYRGMDVDVPAEDAAEPEAGDDFSEEDVEAGGNVDPKRKTRQQRAKARKAHLQKVEAAKRKQDRIDTAALLQLPAEKRRQVKLAAARAEATALRRAQKQHLLTTNGLLGQKIGKHKVPARQIDVQVGDDLSESLRTLKQEGNLFRDRYTKLQARALVEPRSKQMPRKRKFKLKEFETHDYKRFT